jgi:hypothetical protein
MELLACGVVWWSEQQAAGAPKSPKIAKNRQRNILAETDRLNKYFRRPKRRMGFYGIPPGRFPHHLNNDCFVFPAKSTRNQVDIWFGAISNLRIQGWFTSMPAHFSEIIQIK